MNANMFDDVAKLNARLLVGRVRCHAVATFDDVVGLLLTVNLCYDREVNHSLLSHQRNIFSISPDEFLLKYEFPKPAKTDRNIVFYGQGAVKSNSALEIAGKLGYKGVLRMTGGYDEWIEKTHLDGRI